MALTTLAEVLGPAMAGRYAVGAFNANNLEYIQAIVEGATREGAPVVVQASQGAIRHAGLEQIVAMVKVAAKQTRVPVVLHLDHGTDLELVRECIRRGFTSVMFDGSRLPWEENVRLTAQVVAWAHEAGISAEGELGRVPAVRDGLGEEELRELMTDPAQAVRFAAETGVDALAVSVGSVHQMQREEARLDVERVAAIADGAARAGIRLPLVLHGSSGVSPASLQEAIRAGICKVNVATALNVAFKRGLLSALQENPEGVDPRPFLAAAREETMATVRASMRLFGCTGRA
ncbi:MAG TPA: class II fructose-bisphosphate aldolase family protein [Firmicutes bacterium]|nr:class II fructose-bisphosphate aldolase family protein [Bacillota bacterium]